MTKYEDDDESLNYILIPPVRIESSTPRFLERVFSVLSRMRTALVEDSFFKKIKDSNFNHLFIPASRFGRQRDVLRNVKLNNDPKTYQGKWSRRKKGSYEKTEPRFEVLASGSTSLSSSGGRGRGRGGVSQAQDVDYSGKSNKGDYTKKYLEKKLAEKKEAEAKTQAEEKRIRDGRDTPEEKMLRGNAQSLHDQLMGWKSKQGTGEMDEATVQANIKQVEQQLYSIDEKYRPR